MVEGTVGPVFARYRNQPAAIQTEAVTGVIADAGLVAIGAVVRAAAGDRRDAAQREADAEIAVAAMAVIGDLQCWRDAGGAGRDLDVERPGRRAVTIDAEASGQVANRLRGRIARSAGCRRLRLARRGQQAHGKAQ
ncbi:hypothetical protein D3C76_1315240 [compost metagenome]